MATPVLAALALANTLLALGWAREHRLRRAMLSLLKRVFSKDEEKQ